MSIEKPVTRTGPVWYLSLIAVTSCKMRSYAAAVNDHAFPSDISFGTAVSTPRWLCVIAAATPSDFGALIIVDETLDPVEQENVYGSSHFRSWVHLLTN